VSGRRKTRLPRPSAAGRPARTSSLASPGTAPSWRGAPGACFRVRRRSSGRCCGAGWSRSGTSAPASGGLDGDLRALQPAADKPDPGLPDPEQSAGGEQHDEQEDGADRRLVAGPPDVVVEEAPAEVDALHVDVHDLE